MADETPAAERVRLQGYIANSLRVRRKLALVLAALAPVAVGSFALDRTIGFLAVISVVVVGISGYWITFGHISEWRGRIAELDRREKDGERRVVRRAR